mmetsp:Transcript_28729/g.86049  ORF Transcript_28729/g.86049 Transcript_28729/m.86049 type:complete len:365 (-) Transcript_28729:25-1119(-)
MASTTGTDYSAISVSSSSMKTKSPSMTVSAPGGIVKEYEMDEESHTIEPVPEAEAESTVMNFSLLANVVLTVAKTFVTFQSGSLAVLASLIDSALDLLSQLVLFTASVQRKTRSVAYPAGRARLEPVSVVVCAMLMGVSAMGVIFAAARQLFDLVAGRPIDVEIDELNGLIMLVAVVWKFALWLWIVKRHAALAADSPGVAAVAQDHFNDVLSNVFALAAAVLAARYGLDAADPVGAILISLYIAYSWLDTGIEQVQHLVGKTADPDFLAELRSCAANYSSQMQCDIVRAYHFGPRYLVELEMVMDAATPLRVTHDLALDLQQRVELIPLVERCFVHVDYDFRTVDEHDPSSWSPGRPEKKALI